MRKLFKNISLAKLLTLMAVVGLTVSWTSKDFSDEPKTGWYSITVNSSDQDNKSLQQITGFVNTTPPTGSCSVTNKDKPCQVHLDLSNFNSTTPIEEMSVQQALTAGATISEGYAREEE